MNFRDCSKLLTDYGYKRSKKSIKSGDQGICYFYQNNVKVEVRNETDSHYSVLCLVFINDEDGTYRLINASDEDAIKDYVKKLDRDISIGKLLD